MIKINNEKKCICPNDWINNKTKKFHLTIEDIINIPIGKTINIFLLDKNILNMSCRLEINEPNVPTKPSIFFRNGYFISFTKIDNGIKGKWKFNKNPKKTYIKEFDINIKDKWIPLKNEKIFYREELDDCDIINLKNKKYTEFSKYTRLGWRGPMMLLNDIDKDYMIYWNN